MSNGANNYPSRSDCEKQYRDHFRVYASLLEELRSNIHDTITTTGDHFTIKSRVKSFDSYFSKLLRRLDTCNRNGIRNPIYDVLGIRIVCPFLETVTSVDRLLHDHYTVIEVERRGQEQSFREFGYSSTHIILEIPPEIASHHPAVDLRHCEVQIRTFLQDAWAEVEHELVYKAEITPLDEPLRRKLAALNANLTLADITFQEIRDYQRQLHRELDKRRRSFSRQLEKQLPVETPSREAGAEKAFPVPGPIPRDPANLDNMLLEALHAHNRQEFSAAIDLYTAILGQAHVPHIRAMVLIHRGKARFCLSEYADALNDFTLATQCEPNNGRAWYHLGVVNRVINNPASAIKALKQCVVVDPYHCEGMVALGRVYCDIGDLPAALEQCERCLTIKPDTVAAKELKNIVIKDMKL